MKSNAELVGELCKQANIDGQTAFAILRRKDVEIAKEKELLKQDLLWHLAPNISDTVQQTINEIIDKHFPQE